MEIFSIEAYFFTFYSTLQYITLILITIIVETNTSQLRTRLYITISEMFQHPFYRLIPKFPIVYPAPNFKGNLVR